MPWKISYIFIIWSIFNMTNQNSWNQFTNIHIPLMREWGMFMKEFPRNMMERTGESGLWSDQYHPTRSIFIIFYGLRSIFDEIKIADWLIVGTDWADLITIYFLVKLWKPIAQKPINQKNKLIIGINSSLLRRPITINTQKQ